MHKAHAVSRKVVRFGVWVLGGDGGGSAYLSCRRQGNHGCAHVLAWGGGGSEGALRGRRRHAYCP